MDKCTHQGCNIEIYKELAQCILHCKKDNWNNNKINEFWNYLQKNLLTQINNNFANIIFPKFEEENEQNFDSTNFFTVQYKKDTITNLFVNKEIQFRNCTFLDIADFSKYYFKHDIVFDNCKFIKGIVLNSDYTEKIGFVNGCNFNHTELDLSHKTFKNSFIFTNNINIENINCEKTNFNVVSFKNSKFKKANFSYTNFNDKVSFINTEFEEDIEFKFTNFEKISFFRDTTFHKKLDLRDAIFKDEVSFLNIKINYLNRETARIIKHSFEQQDNIIEANRFYALEMDAREEELNDKNHKDYDILEWLIFKVHKMSSNHSQDWLLVLYWILFVGFISSLFNFYLIDKHTISNTIKEYHITIFIISTLFLSIIYYCLKTIPKLFYLVFLFSMYTFITHDIHYLSYFANNLNPFSVMKHSDSITLVELIFKIILGYLYYQLIISIRQNTRRK